MVRYWNWKAFVGINSPKFCTKYHRLVIWFDKPTAFLVSSNSYFIDKHSACIYVASYASQMSSGPARPKACLRVGASALKNGFSANAVTLVPCLGSVPS